ncbi:hypothetical protein FFLO_00790 [Filobasidium floriforme]|uniref:Zinc knuckle-domain-containing protein n=1 Tax=Filobasidium floriforme TaxID=5210 RepID=A0A8K0JVR5_9TREE|nr:zinc knuckle-domain-containing protein [Filobasidium floriforme]KAG7571278.1 hypothetical protein FFLO_00790 [Filobasidium floriforme]KAH8085842.1 zinc knuckle-domain-containing protein [Filobasidium floriforme]
MSSFNRPKQLQRSDKAPPSTVCQKCTLKGHYTYQCKNPRPYVPRLSRSQRLEKDLKIGDTKKKGDGPAIELPDEFRTK